MDAFIIYAGSYVFGALLASGEISFHAIVYALLIASFPVNFVYSLNSVSDRDIDKINKPHRPLASGKINLTKAKIYVLILLTISFALGFLFESTVSKFYYFLILLCGILYSNPIYPFKRNKYLSAITTSALLVAPMLVAVTRSDGKIPDEIVSLGLFIFFFLLITVPLKDIEDIEGDTLNKSQNWYSFLGIRLVYGNAFLNFLLTVAVIVFMPQNEYKLIIIIFFLIQLSVTVMNLRNRNWINSLYKQKILATIAYMFAMWIYQFLR